MKINLTTQRKAVFEIIQYSNDHPTAAEIIERLRARGYNFAYGTVYNSLRYLTEVELIRELKLGEASSRYDARMDDHHHIICRKCGRVDEVMTETPAEWMQSVATETQYDVHFSNVIFEGVCSECASSS